jgi:hypothetical protein
VGQPCIIGAGERRTPILPRGNTHCRYERLGEPAFVDDVAEDVVASGRKGWQWRRERDRVGGRRVQVRKRPAALADDEHVHQLSVIGDQG